MSAVRMNGHDRPCPLSYDHAPTGATCTCRTTEQEQDREALLTPEQRRAIGCDCWHTNGVYHHKRGCPVPAVLPVLAEVVRQAEQRGRRQERADHLTPDEVAALIHEAERRGYERGTTDGLLAAGSGADQ